MIKESSSTSDPGNPVRMGSDARLYSPLYDDHYCSSSGGREECAHVFHNGNGLPRRWAGRSSFTIAELGFGSGFNFIETLQLWRNHRTNDQHLHFVSFELWPLSPSLMRQAHAPWADTEEDSEALINLLASGSREEVLAIDNQTSLRLIRGDCRETLPGWDGCADCWFLDGFSPANNPEMWTQSVAENVFSHTVPGGTFSTYASAGWVRENFSKAGFEVSRQPGFAQKKHMSIGIRAS